MHCESLGLIPENKESEGKRVLGQGYELPRYLMEKTSSMFLATNRWNKQGNPFPDNYRVPDVYPAGIKQIQDNASSLHLLRPLRKEYTCG